MNDKKNLKPGPDDMDGRFLRLFVRHEQALRAYARVMTGFDDISAIPDVEPESWALVTHRQLAKMTVPLDMVALQVRQSPFKFGEIVLGNSWQAVVNP